MSIDHYDPLCHKLVKAGQHAIFEYLEKLDELKISSQSWKTHVHSTATFFF